MFNLSDYLKIFQEGTVSEKLDAISRISEINDSGHENIALIQAFSDENWMVRKTAHEALVLKGNKAVNSLLDIMPIENEDTAYWTIKTFESLGGDNYKHIIKLLSSKQTNIKIFCVRALRKFSNNNVINTLINYLKDSDWYLRKESAKSLEKIGKDALPSLKRAFVENAKKSGSEDLSYWTIKLLAKIIGVNAIPSFMNLFKSEKQNNRYYAVTALGEIEDDEATEFLISALEDKSWIIRERAAQILKLRGEKIIPALKAAFYSRGSDAKFWTIKIISSIMGPASIEFLSKVSKSNDDEIKYFVINALGENQDEESIKLLIEFFKEKSWILRKRASEIIQRIGNRAIDFLVEKTSSNNEDEKYFAINTLAYIGGRGHEILANLLRNDDYKTKIDIINSFEDITNDLVSNKNIRNAFYGCLVDKSWKIRYSASKLINEISEPIFGELLELFARKNNDINYWISQILSKNIELFFQRIEIFLKSRDKDLVVLGYNIILWVVKHCKPQTQIKLFNLSKVYYQNRYFPILLPYIRQYPAKYILFLIDFITTVVPRNYIKEYINEHIFDDDFFIRTLFLELAFVIDDEEALAFVEEVLNNKNSEFFNKIFSLFVNENKTLLKYDKYNELRNFIVKSKEAQRNDPLIKILSCEDEEEIMDVFNLINIDLYEVREKLGKFFIKTTSKTVARVFPFYILRLDDEYKDELLKIIHKNFDPNKILFFLENTFDNNEVFNFYKNNILSEVLTIDKKIEIFQNAILHKNKNFRKYIITELISIALERIDTFFTEFFTNQKDRNIALDVFGTLIININHKDYKIRDRIKNLILNNGISFLDLIVKFRYSCNEPMMKYMFDSLIEEIKGDKLALLKAFMKSEDESLNKGAALIIKDLGLSSHIA